MRYALIVFGLLGAIAYAQAPKTILNRAEGEDLILKVTEAGGNQKEVARFKASGTNTLMPAGSITAFAGSVIPDGWVLCDGTAYDSVTNPEYAALYAAIGTTWGGADGTDFQVPDLRGVFLRGSGTHGTLVNHSSTPYAGPALGQSQNDALDAHGHILYYSNRGGVSSGGVSSSNEFFLDSVFVNNYSGVIGNNNDIDVSNVAANTVRAANTSTETRPVNVGINYIIKL